MPDLLAARSQMGTSLAFHIIFALVGIGMPALMVVAERRWLATGDEIYYELAQRWAKGTAILFAVGAVSGTVLSFELGLLWPGFMRFAGPIIGMPFSLEGFAFFMEAIFLGIYLYGWDRISPRAHLFAGVLVAVSGAVSGITVVIANAWMNTPTGFDLVNGVVTNVDPIAAMLNPAALSQTIHMTLAAYAATGFAVAGIHAFLLLKDSGERVPSPGARDRAAGRRSRLPRCSRSPGTWPPARWRATSRRNSPRWSSCFAPSAGRRSSWGDGRTWPRARRGSRCASPMDSRCSRSTTLTPK